MQEWEDFYEQPEVYIKLQEDAFEQHHVIYVKLVAWDLL
jgi:hypothetical protein